MEDNIQTIIVVIISAFILFIFPVYMAYEKKDDISYALAMRYTQDLVDEVRSKGYITKNMYEDYRAKLKLTGNSYDIQLTHEYNRYDPITNYYRLDGNKYVFVNSSTQEERQKFEREKLQENFGNILSEVPLKEMQMYLQTVYADMGINKIENTYQLSQQVYSTNNILNVLNSERKLQLNTENEVIECSDEPETEDGCQYAYIMNVDDNFNVTIRNTNITLATIIYNMVTANTLDSNTRIYVNYGGAILADRWYGDIDYTKMDHDKLTLGSLQEKVIFEEERTYTMAQQENNPLENIDQSFYRYSAAESEEEMDIDEYTIIFDVKPQSTTQLREKGKLINFDGYNFAMGNALIANPDNTLSVSVGINGISLITSSTKNYIANTEQALELPWYDKEIEETTTTQVEYEYVDEETGEVKKDIREEIVTVTRTELTQRQITEYRKIFFEGNGDGTVTITAVGNSREDKFEQTVEIINDKWLLNTLDVVIENPEEGTYTGQVQGRNAEYEITILGPAISIEAKEIIQETSTILSHPISLEGFVNIKLAVEKNESEKYIVVLHVDGERVAESIEMESLPKISIVGKTVIGKNQIGSMTGYFEGKLRNVRMYK